MPGRGVSSEEGAQVKGGTPIKGEPSSCTYTHKVETKMGEMRFLRSCALATMTVRGFIYHSVPVVLNDSTILAPFFQREPSRAQLLSKYRDHVCIV